MFPIRSAAFLAPDVKRFEVEAPRIAHKQRPGQFVIVRVYDHGERIPLTIADADPGRGTVTLIVQGIGKTTKLMNALEAGDALLDVVGPLGRASEVEKFGTAVVIGGGVGAAIAYPTARALRDAGNQVIVILGARTRALLILEAEMRALGADVRLCTDDGSAGTRGLVTDVLGDLIRHQTLDYVLAIGPVPMMRAVAASTRPLSIPTVVSLNSLMVDGTGMCGGCRVQTTAGSKFACVDGPEFDAHAVDFELLALRNRMYVEAEQSALHEFEAHRDEAVDRVRQACRLAEEHPEVEAKSGSPCA
jgi:ferredoxin--NADP+ reductase